jgi:hypothetical protein
MNDGFDRDELFRLFGGATNGTLTSDEQQRMRIVLEGIPEARKLWYLYCDLELGLASWSEAKRIAAEPVSSFLKAPGLQPLNPNSTLGAWIASGAIACLSAIALIGSTLLFERNFFTTHFMPGESEIIAQTVATLLLADECEWLDGGDWMEGQALLAGETLRLRRGMVVLRFESGAEVVMEEETEVELESRGSVRLLSGRLTVRAPDEAAGFVVRTPMSEVKDLGTEFAVSVGSKGDTEVHVMEGQVSLGKPGVTTEDSQRLKEGQAVRFERQTGLIPQLVPLKAPRFMDLIDDATRKPNEGALSTVESFELISNKLSLQETKSNYGWKGPWRDKVIAGSESNREDVLVIADGKLNPGWPVAGGYGAALRIDPGSGSRFRTMSHPIALNQDGITYVSLMVQQEIRELSSDEPYRAWLGFHSAKRYWGDRITFRIGTIGKRQIEIRSGESFVSPSAITRRGSQFWIGKIISRKKGEDEIFFRIYDEGEPFDLVEPGTWSVQSRGFFSDAILDVVELGAQGAVPCWFDELRVGNNWRAAVLEAPRMEFSDIESPN